MKLICIGGPCHLERMSYDGPRMYITNFSSDIRMCIQESTYILQKLGHRMSKVAMFYRHETIIDSDAAQAFIEYLVNQEVERQNA